MKKMIRAVMLMSMLACGSMTAYAAENTASVTSLNEQVIEVGCSPVAEVGAETSIENNVVEEVVLVDEFTATTVAFGGEGQAAPVEEQAAGVEANLGASLGNFKLTSYCGCRKCNGKWTGYPTALGTDYVHGRTIAVDKRVIPLGTWVYINIPGDGWQKFRAEDTGSAIKNNRIDIYVDAHNLCRQAKYNGVCEVRLAK